MSPNHPNPIHAEILACLAQVEALRDEIRLQAHLAGMEVDSRADVLGDELETIASEIRRAGSSVGVTLLERLRRTEEKLTDFARSLPGGI